MKVPVDWISQYELMLRFVSYELFVAFADSCRAVKRKLSLWEPLSGCPSVCILSVSTNILDVPVQLWYPIGPRYLDILV
jgi:hypothetical protein